MKRSPLKRNNPLRAKVGLTEKSTEALLGVVPGIQRASTFKAAPRPMRKRARNNPGWVSVAKVIWNDPENDHCCRVCGVWLGEDFSPTFYHHLLHRGSYKRYARDPRNLLQTCAMDHDCAHRFGIEALARDPALSPRSHMEAWARILITRDELLREANGLRPEPGADAEGGVPPEEDRANSERRKGR